MVVKVNAKINLSLNVGESENGFHRLDTIMASVDIADAISVAPSDKGISVRFSSIAEGEKTNAYKACKLLQERVGFSGADIFIEQNIPSCAGLGGSSADAAGVIRALSVIYGIDEQTQIEVAKQVGSDVAYMLKGGFARLRGTHAELEYFSAPTGEEILLYGEGKVNTGECFHLFDEMGKSGTLTNNDEFITSLIEKGVVGSFSHFSNTLYESAKTLNSQIEKVKLVMEECGLFASMTGSGSFVFGVGEKSAMDEAQARLKSAIRTKIVPYGVQILS